MPTASWTFGAFAKQRDKLRADQKRAAGRDFLAICRSVDLFETADYCGLTLTGAALLLGQQMRDTNFRERAYRLGAAEAASFEAPPSKDRVESIQITSAGEPPADLLTRLDAALFRRVSRPGAEFAIYLGEGILSEWTPHRSSGVCIARCVLPGGRIGATAGRAVSEGDDRGRPHVQRGGAQPSAAAYAAAEPGMMSGGAVADIGHPQQDEATSDAGPDDAAARLERPPQFYRLAAFIAPSCSATWRLDRATAGECAALMRSAITQQGPVSIKDAIEAVRQGFAQASLGVQVRKKLEDSIEALIEDEVIQEIERGFYCDPDRPVIARFRTGLGDRLRALKAVPQVEVAAAVLDLLASGEPVPDADVPAGVAERLGYSLKNSASAALPKRIALAIERLTQVGKLVRSGDGLTLNDRPAGAGWNLVGIDFSLSEADQDRPPPATDDASRPDPGEAEARPSEDDDEGVDETDAALGVLTASITRMPETSMRAPGQS